jgi:hypothetical protein
VIRLRKRVLTLVRSPGTDVVDSNCGMRGFRKEALERLDLRAHGMDFGMEILMKSAQLGFKIGQVPIRLAPRVGDSKLETSPDGWRNLRYLLMRSPDHLFVLPGSVLLLLGLLTLLVQALLPFGIQIGGLTWRPDYAPVVLGAVGAPVIESSNGHEPHKVPVERVGETNGAAPTLETV